MWFAEGDASPFSSEEGRGVRIALIVPTKEELIQNLNRWQPRPLSEGILFDGFGVFFLDEGDTDKSANLPQ